MNLDSDGDHPFTVCNEFGCAPIDYCGGNPPNGSISYIDGCAIIPKLFAHDVVCGEENFCAAHSCTVGQFDNSVDNLVCLRPFTNASDVVTSNQLGGDINFSKLAIGVGGELQCSPEFTVGFKGQPFCPDGFVYEDLNSRCERPITENCDYGYVGNLATGCDNLLQEDADQGTLYTSGCFKDEFGVVVTEPNVLNAQACCLDYSIISGSDIYEIYTIDSFEQYVRVY